MSIRDAVAPAVCRLRGHVETTRTLRLDDREREVRLECRRCGVELGRRVDPVLLRLELPYGLPLLCYATGRFGACGHLLAECEGGRCGGVFCPTCGQWRCSGCEEFAQAIQSVMAEGVARLEEELGLNDG